MITEEILNKIHLSNLNGETLTAKELTSAGLNYYDINKLMNNGVLEKVKRGEYGLLSFESLYNYGVYLIDQQDYHNAHDVFSKCHELNPSHLGTCEYLFVISINRKYDKEAYELLEKIISLSQTRPNSINSIYLYFLSYIMQPSKKYIGSIKNMRLKDLLLSSRKEKLTYEKKASSLTEVIHHLGSIERNDTLSPSEKAVIQILIRESQEKEAKIHEKILSLVTEEQYEKVVSSLEVRNRLINLSTYYQSILLLSKRILEITQTGNIPHASNVPGSNFNSITQNILHNKFKRAYKLKLDSLEKTGNDKETDIEYILLTKIIELTASIEQDQKLNTIFPENYHNKEIENILVNLFQNNVELAIELIRKYLQELGKSEYEFLLTELIKISVLEKDALYLKPGSILIELSNDEYDYNIFFYIQDFYNSLNASQFTIARIYLNIIIKYSEESKDIINNLETDLVNALKRYTDKYESTKKYLLEKLAEMKSNKEPILVLEQTAKPDRDLMYKVIRTIPELIGFSIGEEPKRVILRYINPSVKSEIYSSKLINSKISFGKKDYQTSLALSFQVLQNPSFDPYAKNFAEIYAHIGCIYLEMGEVDNAIKYLTIATELNKEDPNQMFIYDYTELIHRLTHNSPSNSSAFNKESLLVTTLTPPQIQSTPTYSDDLDDIFGIQNIEEIAYNITELKLSVDLTCQKLHLTDEQVQLVKLIYARDYYIEGMYKQGDKLLEEVAKSKNKSRKVQNLVNNIRKNRKFYRERRNAKSRKRIMKPATDNE